MALDDFDRRILTALQEDGRLSNSDLARRVGLSPSPCWRRVRRLEAEGMIRGYRAVLGQRPLGLGITAMVRVSANTQDAAMLQGLENALRALPEVVACYIVGGEYDFLLHVVAEDLDTYSDFALKVLAGLPGVRQIHSAFVLREVKPFAGLPVRERAPAVTARRGGRSASAARAPSRPARRS